MPTIPEMLLRGWRRKGRKATRGRMMLGIALMFAAANPANATTPDLTGTWKIVTPRVSIVANRDAIPFTAKGKQAFAQNRRDKARKNLEYDQTASRCAAPGTPRVMLTSKRFRIFQDPEMIMMSFEWNRFRRVITLPELTRQIYIFGEDEEAKLVGTKMGTSRARWEGDTLVVVTNELSDGTLLDDLVPHGFDAKVTERLTLRDSNTLEDRITIEDPEYFTKPWETVVTYTRQPDTVFPEEVCLDRQFGQPELPKK